MLVVYLAYRNHDTAWLTAGLAVAGSLIGSFVLYYLARKGGERYLAKYTSKGRGATLRQWFSRYGMVTVVVPALFPIPLPMKIFILSAGALGVHPLIFAAVVVGARSIRYFGLAWLGTKLGDGTIPYLKSHLAPMLLIAAGVFLGLFLLIHYFGPKPKSEPELAAAPRS